jgi:hypothetical protein
MPEDDLLQEGTAIPMGQTSECEIPNLEAQPGFFVQLAKQIIVKGHLYSIRPDSNTGRAKRQ